MSLLDIPKELRYFVYSFVLYHETAQITPCCQLGSLRLRFQGVGLFGTNKQLKKEAEEYFRESNAFVAVLVYGREQFVDGRSHGRDDCPAAVEPSVPTAMSTQSQDMMEETQRKIAIFKHCKASMLIRETRDGYTWKCSVLPTAFLPSILSRITCRIDVGKETTLRILLFLAECPEHEMTVAGGIRLTSASWYGAQKARLIGAVKDHAPGKVGLSTLTPNHDGDKSVLASLQESQSIFETCPDLHPSHSEMKAEIEGSQRARPEDHRCVIVRQTRYRLQSLANLATAADGNSRPHLITAANRALLEGMAAMKNIAQARGDRFPPSPYVPEPEGPELLAKSLGSSFLQSIWQRLGSKQMIRQNNSSKTDTSKSVSSRIPLSCGCRAAPCGLDELQPHDPTMPYRWTGP